MEQQTQNSAEFYARLEQKLSESTTFPSEYLYKFIVPAHEQKIAELYKVFDGTQAQIITKNSSSGKYTSFSVRILAQSTQEIIQLYKEAGKVEGIVSL